jgi:hypothetical protein
MSWIANAIDNACQVLIKHEVALDIKVVSYSAPMDENLQKVIQKY